LTFGAAAGQIFRNEYAEIAFGLNNAVPYPLYIQGRYTSNTAHPISLNPLGGNVGIGTISSIQANFQVGISSALTNYQGAPVGIMLPTGSGSWLELAENTTNGTSFRISKDASTGVVINTNVKDLGFKADAYGTAISGAQIVLKTSGDVGIGYTSAQSGAKLSVNGAGFFNGIVTATTVVVSGAGGDITGATNITASGLITGGSFLSTAATTATSTATGALQVRGGVGIGSNLFVGNQIIVGTTVVTGTNFLQVNSDVSFNQVTVGRGSGTANSFNTAVGLGALGVNTSGGSNTAVGRLAMSSNLNGSNNSAFGIGALNANTSGQYNVGVGHSAIQNNTSGQFNVAVGYSAGSGGVGNTANGNISVGYETLTAVTGSYNIAIGWQAGKSITSGQYNVIIGNYTGSLAPISATGSSNIVLATGGGDVRLFFDSSGNAVLNGVTGGGGNNLVLRGGTAASSEGPQIVMGYGNNTSSAIAGQANYTWNIDVAGGAANNDFRIFRQNSAGATAVGINILESNAGVQLLSLGVGTPGSGTTGEIRATNEITAYYSDRRLKENVKVIDRAVSKVQSLHGITYTPNELAESFGYLRTTKLVGLFADEVEAVLPEATRPAPFDVDETGASKSGENYKTIQYEKLVPLLVEAIKEQQLAIDLLKYELQELKNSNK
jgi:hypothetical protein